MEFLKSSMILSSLFLICFLSCACDNDRLPNLWQPSDRDMISLKELNKIAQARHEKKALDEQQELTQDNQMPVSIEKNQSLIWSIICYVVGWEK